jgi:hypothetical protein
MLTQSQLLTSTKILHERAQRARQKQSLLEARIMNAMSLFGTLSPYRLHLPRVRLWGLIDRREAVGGPGKKLTQSGRHQ